MAADEVTGSGRSLDVHVVAPDGEVWAGSASFVIARAAGGDIGVLPAHESTLSVMGAGTVRIDRDHEEPIEVEVSGGFLSVGVTSGGVTRVDVLAEHATTLL
jgi:F-type H+-transporting ATPase subunit epsilon